LPTRCMKIFFGPTKRVLQMRESSKVHCPHFLQSKITKNKIQITGLKPRIQFWSS
jgi:hypothetical protein